MSNAPFSALGSAIFHFYCISSFLPLLYLSSFSLPFLILPVSLVDFISFVHSLMSYFIKYCY